MTFLETIEINRKKFSKFNTIKYNRFQQLINNVNVKKIINCIPLLLSVNNKKLPGYIEKDVPSGIVNYKLDEDTKRFIRAKFPTIQIEINLNNPFIEMLAVMGSIGTIAYNKKSDFDYWVCVNQRSIPRELFENFMLKVEAIQKWASKEAEVPVHLFVNDIENIKQNIFAEDDDEAFGTTMGAVLKDEFFRSSIIIAGKIPFWWVVPHFFKDEEYEELFERLPEEDKKYKFIDLGNLYKISREDFLGSALFQIIKSLGNPFKSIIKIGVLEKYLFGSEDSPLLSQYLKINIMRENLDSAILDSYLLMFKEVYDYYISLTEDKKSLTILRQNLYLKINPQLSKYIGIKQKKNLPYKVNVMTEYVNHWGWRIDDIKELDNFDYWDFNKVIQFWDCVKKFMLLSYQRISNQLPTLNLQSKISESDFMLLSRKIKTHFTRKDDKIEQFITFKDTPNEAILYIEPVSQGIHATEWKLYKRNTSEKDTFIKTTIKTEKNLLKLLVWTALNQIYDPVFTRLNIQSGYSRINQNLVNNLLNQIAPFFSKERLYLKNEYFTKKTFNILNFIILNFDKEKATSIETIHYLYHTSWGESFLKEYRSEDAINQILYIVLRDGLILKRNYDDYCIINTPEPYKKEYKNIINIFKEAYLTIIEEKKISSARFVTFIDNKFIDITRDSQKVTLDIYPSLINLLASISLKPKKEILYKFYGNEISLNSLNSIYIISKKKSITIAYEEKGDILIAYVMNEYGNIFAFIKQKKDTKLFLINLYKFCKNVITRINQTTNLPMINENNINIYCSTTDKFGKTTIVDNTSLIIRENIMQSDKSNTLTASISRHKDKEILYNILFPDKESSGFINRKQLSNIKGKIEEFKRKGVKLHNIVSDIIFTDLTKDEQNFGSTLYLLEKYKLEFIITKLF